MDKNLLPIPMSRAERIWGIRYLLFQLVFLSTLITLILYAVYPGFSNALLNFLYFSINFLAVTWIFRRYLLASLSHLRRDLMQILLCAATGFFLYWILNIGLSAMIRLAFPAHFNVNDAVIGQASQRHFWLMAVGSVLLAPMTEELLYRGLLFGSLHGRSRALAYGVSILVFCAIHVSGYAQIFPFHLLAVSFIQYVPGGLILAWAYERSGNIFCPIAIHMAINVVGTLSMR
jgi:membrane protease YdiL (CAAX protease family)